MKFVKEKIEENKIVAPCMLSRTSSERLNYYSTKQISLPSRNHPVNPV